MEALQKEQTIPTRKRSSGPLVGVRSALERRASRSSRQTLRRWRPRGSPL